MRVRKRVLVAAACVVGTFVLLGIHRRPSEPAYHGKTLSNWLQQYVQNTPMYAAPGERFRSEEAQAVRAIGSNAIPYLLKWTQEHDGPRFPFLVRILPRSFHRTRVGQWILGDASKSQGLLAICGFDILGSNGAPALPALTKLANNYARLETANGAISAIGKMGTLGLPVLSAALADTNRITRERIVFEIWLSVAPTAGTNACVPPLLTAANDPDANVRQCARNALRQIAPAALTNSPAH